MASIAAPLKEEALSSLLEIIDFIPAPKALILDHDLSTTVSLVVNFTTLKEHGVDRIFWLQSNLPPAMDSSQFSSVVFITSPNPSQLTKIAAYSHKLLNQAKAPNVSVISAPSCPMLVSKVFESHGIYDEIATYSWPVYFLPISDDEAAPVLSLSLSGGGFKETYFDGLPTAIHLAAEAVQNIQQKHGQISKIIGKGQSAKLLADLLLYQKEKRDAELSDNILKQDSPSPEDTFDSMYGNTFIGSEIDSLIIIDRSCDFVAPLLTQLTYHGLIDEFYKISDSGSVELPAAVVSAPDSKNTSSSTSSISNPAGKKTTVLQDPLFREIHNLNFAVVGQSLNKVARQLQADYEKRHEAQSVSEIKAFVNKLGGLQSLHQNLRFHTSLAEDLMGLVQGDTFNSWLEIQQNLVADSLDTYTLHSMIDTLISRSADISIVLRLVCLECCVRGGMKEKDLDFFKESILQTYGYEHLATLEKLEQADLLFARSSQHPNTFPYLRKQLSLVVDQPIENEGVSELVSDDLNTIPSDISYVYSGYAPISVRLVQSIIDKPSILKNYKRKSTQPGPPVAGWAGVEDILRYLPGPTVEEHHRSLSNERENKLRRILTRNTPGKHKLNSMVLYLGGITYAEIAALQLLTKTSETHNLIIATTGIISGKKMIDLASSNRIDKS